jgi:hypothetical protein
MKTQQPRFHYHAHAVALAGEVTHPFHEIIGVQAPATIPPMGGISSSHKKRYRLPSIVMHHGARSSASGKHHPDTRTHEAMAHAALEGLNIEDVLTVDFVTAHVTATFFTGDEQRPPDKEPRISPHGSMFHRLRIRGRDIELKPNVDLYHELDTLTKVSDAYSKNTNGFKDKFDRDTFIGKENELPTTHHHRFFPWRKQKPTGVLPTYQGHTIVPLFTVLNADVPGVYTVKGNVIDVANFGRIHLGEMVVTPHERRVMMIHADMGSPADADISVCCVCTGTPPLDP